MSKSPIVDERTARRMALDGALLRGPRMPADAEGMLAVIRHFGSVQLDPTRTVERTHLLVLWSRLGAFDRTVLERLLAERQLLEWNAFIIPLERLPELRFQAARWATGGGAWETRVREWVAANDAFRQSVLAQLRAEGPLPSRAIDAAKLASDWKSGGWTHGRSVTRMLEFMGAKAEIMVSGRQGQERLWDLAERVLPPGAPETDLTADEYAELRVAEALRRFGVATHREIKERIAYVSSRDVQSTVDRMVGDGRLDAVSLQLDDRLTEAFSASGAVENARRQQAPRTSLVSPFDPFVYDRDRTERLFAFRYRLEMYVPVAERKYGHFVLPIVHDDRLVGRLDSKTDARSGKLHVHAIHWEEGEPSAGTREAVEGAIAELAAFVGSTEVSYS